MNLEEQGSRRRRVPEKLRSSESRPTFAWTRGPTTRPNSRATCGTRPVGRATQPIYVLRDLRRTGPAGLLRGLAVRTADGSTTIEADAVVFAPRPRDLGGAGRDSHFVGPAVSH